MVAAENSSCTSGCDVEKEGHDEIPITPTTYVCGEEEGFAMLRPLFGPGLALRNRHVLAMVARRARCIQE